MWHNLNEYKIEANIYRLLWKSVHCEPMLQQTTKKLHNIDSIESNMDNILITEKRFKVNGHKVATKTKVTTMLQNCKALSLNLCYIQSVSIKWQRFNWEDTVLCWGKLRFRLFFFMQCEHSGFKNQMWCLAVSTFNSYLCYCHRLGLNLKKSVHVLLWDVSF